MIIATDPETIFSFHDMGNIPPIFDVMKWMIQQGMDTLPRLLLGVSPQHDSKLSHKSIHRQLKPARASATRELLSNHFKSRWLSGSLTSWFDNSISLER